MKLLGFLLVCMAASAFAGDLPDAPQPKREAIKFSVATAWLAGSAVAQVAAEHWGARLCKDESLRAGIPWAGNSKFTGFRPDAADRRTAYTAGGIFLGAGVAELTGHRVLAKRILLVGGVVFYATAGATYWAGCN